MKLFATRPLTMLKGLRNLSSNAVKIVEVGPRDGLQNEATIIPTDVKVNLINRLSSTGLKAIEITSFVSAKWVPQMGDNSKVVSSIDRKPNISYPVLVPNLKGLESAIATSMVDEIAVFGSASNSFSLKNVNCSMEESLQRIKLVVDEAKKHNLRIRGYVSCVVGCPYEGAIDPAAVARVCDELLAQGCYEISLGDTIGVGTQKTMSAMLKEVLAVIPAEKLAVHCHDTYGQALYNVAYSFDKGIRIADSSVSGLGGCPYAKGATGNVATEDLVYMLEGMGLETGVDLAKLIDAGQYICKHLGKPTNSRVNQAMYKAV